MPDVDKTPAPLEELVIKVLGGRTFIRERVVLCGVTRTSLMPNNPNRLAWAIINEGAYDATIANDPNMTTTSGWFLPQGGGVISAIYLEDGESVGLEVFGAGRSSNVNVRVREVIRL